MIAELQGTVWYPVQLDVTLWPLWALWTLWALWALCHLTCLVFTVSLHFIAHRYI